MPAPSREVPAATYDKDVSATPPPEGERSGDGQQCQVSGDRRRGQRRRMMMPAPARAIPARMARSAATEGEAGDDGERVRLGKMYNK